MSEPNKNSVSEEEKKQKSSKYLPSIMGICVGVLGWVFYSILDQDYYPNKVLGVLFWLVSLNLILDPFTQSLKKHLITRAILKIVQGLLIIVLGALAILLLVGSVYIAVMLVFFLVSAPLKIALDLLDVKNSTEISTFLSLTFSSIAFSYKGDTIINNITAFWRRKRKEKIRGELELINTYLGQDQIRFFIYFFYFLAIITATIVDLAEVFNDYSGPNYLFLVLQSFAAFIAFEALVEKKSLMKPWTDKLSALRRFISEIRKNARSNKSPE
ncbi:hypothetical protein [Algoriphagus zhangzhouensis]|uniref:Uncharacterized protein n=1 Tax=Algoriphagus zhangzhouensis TaxID=1073327 RepID=A0A1M7ZDT5_9BACT|nr:hypothetical protein [Algoriphagus zhangzhouensis]TDY45877.1 hypothetical protein A8938_2482 [Algoriphagus zhangzhouensis]SHO63033.1 hypothetical protein SAMN04488108_2479 [Algoriphagus zhangzhouensis]